MRLVSSLAALALLVLGATPIACLSPTLPLPPPGPPEGVNQGADEGFWDVRGHCTQGARVLIKNLGTGVIAGTEDADGDGRYFIRIEAQLCDAGEVSEVVGTNSSDTTFFLFEPTVAGIGDGTCQ